MSLFLIYNARLVDEDIDCMGSVLIEDDKIKSVYLGTKPEVNCESLDAQGQTLMPSFVDMHVHFRYPGQSEKEDLDSGLKAAVNGGFGTVVLMPNTKPVVSSVKMALDIKKEADSKKLAQVFQTVSITKDFAGTDTSHLDELDNNLIPVITEDGHDVASTAVMLDGMKKAAFHNVIVSCHSEAPSLALAAKPYRARALELMKQYSIPAWGADSKNENVPNEVNKEIDENLSKANDLLALAEDSFTERNIDIARLAGCHIHIAHCSTKRSIDAVRRAKAEGINITCEVTPHHLALCGTKAPLLRALVNPPLRSEEDRLSLIQALKDGTADVISTDHAPHTANDKASGSPGFSGIETAFAVANTALVKAGYISLRHLSKIMSANASRILSLNKGKLRPGMQADLVLVNPDLEWKVFGKDFKSKGKASPFENKTLIGKVLKTWFNGKIVKD